jgi:outer membrane biosynthesis protein TonB
MFSRRPFIASFLCHLSLLVILLIDWSFLGLSSKKSVVPLETKLVFSQKTRAPELLPKKDKPQPKKTPEPVSAQKELKPEIKPEIKPKEEPVQEKKALLKAKAPEKKLVAANQTTKAQKKSSESPQKQENYLNELSRLTAELRNSVTDNDKDLEPDDADSREASYFDQIHALIKASFILPPHLDGQKGNKLRAVLRLFLHADGSIKKIEVEKASSDSDFDRAVLDGAHRVNNFGPVPILLQSSLRERGVIVELCPIKCAD